MTPAPPYRAALRPRGALNSLAKRFRHPSHFLVLKDMREPLVGESDFSSLVIPEALHESTAFRACPHDCRDSLPTRLACSCRLAHHRCFLLATARRDVPMALFAIRSVSFAPVTALSAENVLRQQLFHGPFIQHFCSVLRR